MEESGEMINLCRNVRRRQFSSLAIVARRFSHYAR